MIPVKYRTLRMSRKAGRYMPAPIGAGGVQLRLQHAAVGVGQVELGLLRDQAGPQQIAPAPCIHCAGLW